MEYLHRGLTGMTFKDQTDLILKGLTLLFTAILALKALIEYVKAQRWKRFEFVSNQIKDFNADAQVKKVTIMLDWEDIEVELFPERLTDKMVKIDNQMLISSLHPTGRGINRLGYTDEEARIRELFDAFFDKLSLFSVVVRSRLIKKEDLRPHLNYWLNLLANPSVRGQDFVKTVYGFLEHYGYKEVLWLLEEFDYVKPKLEIRS